MPKHLRLEVDGLYKRAGFAASSTDNIFGGSGYYNTRMNVWEIPALLKTNVTLGHVRPFIDFGASFDTSRLSKRRTMFRLPRIRLFTTTRRTCIIATRMAASPA